MKIVSKGFGEENYTIQFPLFLSPKAKISISGDKYEEFFFLENHKVIINVENDLYTFRSFGFKTEQEAQNFILKLSTSIRFLSLKKKFGIRFDHQPTQILEPKVCMPEGWADGIKSKWEPENGIYSLDGIIDSYSTVIIPEHKKIVDGGAVCFNPVILHAPSKISECYLEISEQLDLNKTFGNTQLELAFQVFSTAYFHHIPTLTFTTLVTCLELLSEKKKVDKFTLTLIDEIIYTLKNKLNEPEEQKKNDINKLMSNIGNLKNESIKDAVCRLAYEYYNKYDLIDDSFVLTSENEYNETITEIYTVRSQLVHSGEAKDKKEHQPNHRFWEAFEKLEKIAQNILYNQLIDQYFIKR
jgi:hypothetical protein